MSSSPLAGMVNRLLQSIRVDGQAREAPDGVPRHIPAPDGGGRTGGAPLPGEGWDDEADHDDGVMGWDWILVSKQLYPGSLSNDW